MQVPQIQASKLFDVATVTRAEIIQLLRQWGYDGGAHVHGLLLQIAELKGFAPITIVDVYPDRTHAWEVKVFTDQAEMRSYIKNDCAANFERRVYLGAHNSNRGLAYYVVAWIGQAPDKEAVQKKMKQHGAKL